MKPLADFDELLHRFAEAVKVYGKHAREHEALSEVEQHSEPEPPRHPVTIDRQLRSPFTERKR